MGAAQVAARRHDECNGETEGKRDARMAKRVRTRRNHHGAGSNGNERECAEQFGDAAPKE